MVFFPWIILLNSFVNGILIFSVKISNISLLILFDLVALLFFKFLSTFSICACNISGIFFHVFFFPFIYWLSSFVFYLILFFVTCFLTFLLIYYLLKLLEVFFVSYFLTSLQIIFWTVLLYFTSFSFPCSYS